MSTPSHYPAIDLNKYKNRTLSTKIYFHDKNKAPTQDRITKIKQDNSLSPLHYKHEESLEKASHMRKSIIYTVGKEKKELYTETLCKLKAKIPGVGTYSPEKS
jgi:hypothetical protein